ncbi:hypothetical protein IC229_03240 [Spirosoma sp. BT702]|uniref:Carboxypeptidase regulatory-like domain-containing protein n=1 Tax=Spirosoma profusum TaxID=2771354 RepID=A0A926XTA8_9BACT|nr:hypothetical protein [Spirosoma profusum]MBD2699637.1 hypothetical protein [Spirosoma profusum]
MNYVTLGFSLIFSATLACSQKPLHSKAPTQGICGVVVVKRGNQMPSPDAKTPEAQPVQREVLIFPLLNMNMVDAGENGFIRSVRSAKPIKTVKSDTAGKFCLTLSTGQYSLLVREPKGLYANLYDSQNNIFPIRIEKNRWSNVTVEITHDAVF